jgi:hypothetical protein
MEARAPKGEKRGLNPRGRAAPGVALSVAPRLSLNGVADEPTEPLRCSECKREPREDENPDDEWRAVSDGVGELLISARSAGRGSLGRTWRCPIDRHSFEGIRENSQVLRLARVYSCEVRVSPCTTPTGSHWSKDGVGGSRSPYPVSTSRTSSAGTDGTGLRREQAAPR